MTARFGFVVELIIRVGPKNHVAGAVGDAVAGVGDDLIKELIVCGVGELGDQILLSAKGYESNKELVVDRVPIVEEVANN